MAGISSKAAGSLKNKKGYNGNELQSNEFSNNSGLELYDFNARTYDQQIGRFIQIDPATEEAGQESLTPYQFGLNNPVRYDDPDGKCPPCIAAWRVAQLVQLAIRLLPKGKEGPMNLPITIKDATSVIKTVPNNFPITKNNSTAKNESNETEASTQAQSSGKSKNRLDLDKNAQGDHTTFKRDDQGKVYKYQEWKKNDQNPNGFDPGKRFDGGKPDGTKGKPHVDKKTGESVETPHINEPGKGGVRKPNPSEIPNNPRLQ